MISARYALALVLSGMATLAAGQGLGEAPAPTVPPSGPAPAVPADPRPLADVTARVGYDSASGPVLGAAVRTDRLFGDQSLRFSVEASENALRYGVAYGAPDLFGGRPAFGLRLDADRTEPGDVFDFASETWRLRPELRWPRDGGGEATLYALLSHAEVSEVDPDTSALIREDEGDRTLVALGAELSGRGRADAVALSWGLGLEAGSTDRGHDYVKAQARLSAGRDALDGRLRLTARLRAGALTSLEGDSHIGDRYVLGPASIRGFEYGGFGPRDLAVPGEPALGGNAYAVARLDARLPRLLPPDARIVPGVFLDVGSLWGLDDAAGGVSGEAMVDDDARLRASVGLSLAIGTGLGPVTLSVAHPFEKERYDEVQTVSLGFETRF